MAMLILRDKTGKSKDHALTSLSPDDEQALKEFGRFRNRFELFDPAEMAQKYAPVVNVGEMISCQEYLESIDSFEITNIDTFGALVSFEYEKLHGRKAVELPKDPTHDRTRVKKYANVSDLPILQLALQRFRLQLLNTSRKSKKSYEILEYREEKDLIGAFIFKNEDTIFRTDEGQEFNVPEKMDRSAVVAMSKDIIADCAIGKAKETDGSKERILSIAMVYSFDAVDVD